MKTYSLPKTVRGIIFDIDNTLYRNDDYLHSQTALQLQRLAEVRGRTYEEISDEVKAVQKRMAQALGGKKPSLANTLKEGFGVSISESITWREQLFRPEDFLAEDYRLQRTLETLASRCRIAAVTNNPGIIGRRTLEALGVSSCIPLVLGLDVTGVSKPVLEPFSIAAAEMKLSFAEMVNIGDRWYVDLEVPLSAGLGGILVESMDDVYALPDVLSF